MHNPALYFPYIHIRDDGWLKAAALYWPSVRRLLPRGYEINDSATSAALREAGILQDLDPMPLMRGAELDLAEQLKRNSYRLMTDYSLERAYVDFDGRTFGDSGPNDPALGWIHVTKFPQGLLDQLTDMGLATRGRQTHHTHGGAIQPTDWIGLHPALAGAYMTSLANRISEHSGYDPLTDQPDLRSATVNEDIGSAFEMLVGRESANHPRGEGLGDYVMMALSFVRPRNIDSVTPQQIIDCRKDFAEGLLEFKRYVGDQQAELSYIATLPDRDRRIEAFALHVELTIEKSLRSLERNLALHRIEATRSLLFAGSFAPPAAVATLTANVPAAATATGVVAAVGSAWWSVSEARGKAKKESPVGYLLDARDKLSQKTILTRARKLYRGYH